MSHQVAVFRVLSIVFAIIVTFQQYTNALPRTPQEERYSFSLTTFDPNGRLGQVERAQQAALMGTPIIAISLTSKQQQQQQQQHTQRMIVLVAPQVLPNNVLMIDDGTTRFTQLTNEIVISHSGISADGRILVSAAQRIAIEHQYTFDEEITCATLLHKLSLLMQEYTMKPGTRPFGASLIVAYLPKKYDSIDPPKIYRIDVSGQIQLLDDCTIIHGNKFLQRTGIQDKLDQLHDETIQLSYFDADKIQNKVVAILREALLDGNDKNNIETTNTKDRKKDDDDDNTNHDDDINSNIDELLRDTPSSILTACLSSSSGLNSFSRKRHRLN